MPRFGFATLNHSPLHGHPTQWQSHLDAAAEAGFDALAPDIFWLRALVEEGVSLSTIAAEMRSRKLACMELAGIAIGNVESTRAELEEIVCYAEALEAEFVNARIVESFTFDVDDPVVGSVRTCAEAFGAVGTKVALEFSRGTKLGGVADGQRLIEVAAVPGLGVTLDTWHFFLAPAPAPVPVEAEAEDRQPRTLEAPDWAALDALPIEALANVQLSDGVAYADGRFGEATMNERRLPGEGDFDLSRCARVLAEKGFDGAIILEVLNADWRGRSIEAFASATLASARRHWAASL